ncbi:MAG: hypothetical protein IH624_12200 [Phycisphaerae bacterium]|nr:hypothetical protein [Phycisphaerae bacterium]
MLEEPVLMAEALRNLEISALHFEPRLLFFGGVGLLVAGLCVWLGGLRWATLLAAMIGAMAGLICTSFAERRMAALVLMPIIAAGLAAFLKKPVIILSGAGMAAALTLFMLAGSELQTESLRGPSHPISYDGREPSTLGLSETVTEIHAEVIFWGETLLGAVKRMSSAAWAAGGVAAVVMIGTAFIWPRLITAVTCAGWGTMLIFAGMIIMLLHKGSMPLTFLYTRAAVVNLTLMVMVAFGTVAQLLLCPVERRKQDGRTQKKAGGS